MPQDMAKSQMLTVADVNSHLELTPLDRQKVMFLTAHGGCLLLLFDRFDPVFRWPAPGQNQ
jgi:hypothetical protein